LGRAGGDGPDWENGAALAFLIDGDRRNIGSAADDDDLFLVINGAPEAQTFHLPERPGRSWRTAWSTMENMPRPEKSENGTAIHVEGRSVTVLRAPIPSDRAGE